MKRNMMHVDELPDGQRFVLLAHLEHGGYRMLGSTGTDLLAEKMALKGLNQSDVDWVATLVPMGMYVR